MRTNQAEFDMAANKALAGATGYELRPASNNG
jgi:hypothetical protein